MSQPNVVFVITDDLCWGDIGAHGNTIIRTPHLDQLHAESSRLTHYCSGPLCSPARAGLMTGRYHLRTRVIDTYLGRSMLDPAEITLAHLFTQAGYQTGAFGKWHLGDCYPSRAMDMGFNETLVHNGGGLGQPGDHYKNYARGEAAYFDPILFHNGVPEQHEGYCTDIFTDAAIDFIDANHDKPFFVYLATNAPHSPFTIAEEWVAPYREFDLPEKHARIYGMVENIDMNVGRLRAAIAAIAEKGLTDNTIFIFTSDHGPCGSAQAKGAASETGTRFNAGLRGRKGDMYEGGIRVPHYWCQPGILPAGKDLDCLASPIDILPSLTAACDLTLPETVIDGENLLPILQGTSSPAALSERTLFMQWHRGDVPVRHRNRLAMTGRYKLCRIAESQPDELYDLANDPFETTDVIAEHADLAADLLARYDAWFTDVSSTRPDNYAPVRIKTGTSFENPTILTQQDWRTHGANIHHGHWEIDNQRAEPYRLVLRVEKPLWQLGNLHLRCGEETHLFPAGAEDTVFELPNITLPLGETTIEIWLDSHHFFRPALYLELHSEKTCCRQD